jgi:hypothetical protein
MRLLRGYKRELERMGRDLGKLGRRVDREAKRCR